MEISIYTDDNTQLANVYGGLPDTEHKAACLGESGFGGDNTEICIKISKLPEGTKEIYIRLEP